MLASYIESQSSSSWSRELHRVLKPGGLAIIGSYLDSAALSAFCSGCEDEHLPATVKGLRVYQDKEKVLQEANEAARLNGASSWSSIEFHERQIDWRDCRADDVDELTDAFMDNPVIMTLFQGKPRQQIHREIRDALLQRVDDLGRVVLETRALITILTKWISWKSGSFLHFCMYFTRY